MLAMGDVRGCLPCPLCLKCQLHLMSEGKEQSAQGACHVPGGRGERKHDEA